jgi:hypothetical protein
MRRSVRRSKRSTNRTQRRSARRSTRRSGRRSARKSSRRSARRSSRRSSRRTGRKQLSPWIKHVMAYHKAHPGISYKQAMKRAKSTYKTGFKSPTRSQEF